MTLLTRTCAAKAPIQASSKVTVISSSSDLIGVTTTTIEAMYTVQLCINIYHQSNCAVHTAMHLLVADSVVLPFNDVSARVLLCNCRSPSKRRGTRPVACFLHRRYIITRHNVNPYDSRCTCWCCLPLSHPRSHPLHKLIACCYRLCCHPYRGFSSSAAPWMMRILCHAQRLHPSAMLGHHWQRDAECMAHGSPR